MDLGHVVTQPRKWPIWKHLDPHGQGDLKIRVRDLQTEQSFKRMNIVQSNMAYSLAASTALNLGVLLTATTPAGQISRLAQAAIALSGILGSQVAIGMLKITALDKKLQSFE